MGKVFYYPTKTYWGQMEEWSADVDKYNKEVAQSGEQYQQALIEWREQQRESKRAWQEAEDKRFQQLEQAQGLSRAGQMMRGLGGREEERPERPMPDRPREDLPFGEAIGGMGAYTAQQYFGRRMGQVFQEFEQAFPGARGAWMEAMYGTPQISETASIRGRISGLEEQLGYAQGKLPGLVEQFPHMFKDTAGYRTQEEMAAGLVAGRAAEIPGELEAARAELAGERGRERRPSRAERQEEWRQQYGFESTEDPWAQYLKQYPFQQEFVKVPRRQRGFYPSQSVARARWFT